MPGPSIRYRGLDGEEHWVGVPDATVFVQSLVDEAGATPSDVRDIKGPVAKPRDYCPLLLIAAALLALLAVIGWLVRRFTRPPAERGAAALGARAGARRAAALQAAGLIDAGRYEELPRPSRHRARVHRGALPPAGAGDDHRGVPAGGAATGAAGAGAPRAARPVPRRGRPGEVPRPPGPTPGDAERAFAAGRDFVRSTAPEEPRAAA
ncbi:MAG: hypothetical protein U0802_21070 [Candidatus Binatia bacterium]